MIWPTEFAQLQKSPSSPMPATPDDLFAYLDSLRIAHRTVTHPPLFTVEESRGLRGTIPGGHTKNLFLKDKKDSLVLVVALEDAVIELNIMTTSIASADLVRFLKATSHEPRLIALHGETG